MFITKQLLSKKIAPKKPENNMSSACKTVILCSNLLGKPQDTAHFMDMSLWTLSRNAENVKLDST